MVAISSLPHRTGSLTPETTVTGGSSLVGRWLASLLMVTATSACGDALGDNEPPARVDSDTMCAGEAPLCVASCGQRTEALATAECVAATWRCDAGIRIDLCCDPVLTPERCEEWGDVCEPGSPCPNGYTCVESRSQLVPADGGVCRLGDLSIPASLQQCDELSMTPPEVLPMLGLAPVKLKGVVSVDMICEDRKCDASNPCCQRCSGAYWLDLTSELGSRVLLPIRTDTIACDGTNCGFSCSPMQAGRRVWVWGLFEPGSAAGSAGLLHYAGHCDG